MVVSLLIIKNQLQALALQIKIVWDQYLSKNNTSYLYYPYEYLSYKEEVLKIYFVKKLKTSLGLIINRCNDMNFFCAFKNILFLYMISSIIGKKYIPDISTMIRERHT